LHILLVFVIIKIRSSLILPRYAAGYSVAFSDAMPFMLISQESLDDLNRRIADTAAADASPGALASHDDELKLATGAVVRPAGAGGVAGARSTEALFSAALPMNRFRPNFVVSGGRAYGEDTWLQLFVGPLPMTVICEGGVRG